jgi:glutamyl-tRNA synthetase
VAVDDAAMRVSDVLRGDDLLPSTARQILLFRALGLPVPAFAHVPLVVGPDGERLAKRHGALSVGELRERGVAPSELLGMLAGSSGLVPSGTRVMPTDLVQGFRLEAVPRQPARVDGRGSIAP